MSKEKAYKLSIEHRQFDESLYAEMEELLNHAKKTSDKLIRLHLKLPDQEIVAEMKETEKLLNTISQKWITEILFVLFMKETQRFNELKKGLEGISSRTLSDKLKMLVENGYAERKIFDEYPPRIEYSLSEKGKTTSRLIVPLVYYLLWTEKAF